MHVIFSLWVSFYSDHSGQVCGLQYLLKCLALFHFRTTDRCHQPDQLHSSYVDHKVNLEMIRVTKQVLSLCWSHSGTNNLENTTSSSSRGAGLGTPRMWVPQGARGVGRGGGRRQTFPQTQGRLRRDTYPPQRGEGVYGEGKGPGWKELCVCSWEYTV